MKVDRITDLGVIYVIDTAGDEPWRATLNPGDSLAGYSPDIVAAANATWTQEVLDNWDQLTQV